MRNIFKKAAALVLSVSLLLSALFTGAVAVNAAGVVNTRTVSEVVTKGDRTYIEHNGVPYLMYGIQMRLDWQYADKIVLYPESNEKLSSGTSLAVHCLRICLAMQGMWV